MPEDALLALVGDVMGLLDLPELHLGLIRAVREAVWADWVSVTDVAPAPEETVALTDPGFTPEEHATFARHAHENPLFARYRRTLDGRAYRFSDVTTPAALQATMLHRVFYGPIGLEHQIAFTLPHAAGRVLAVVLSRREQDFSDGERDLLDAARPFLIQAYRNAIAHTRLARELALREHSPRLPLADAGLAALLRERAISPRQAEVLSWVATGRSDGAVAGELGLSPRTVQKHLQACFARLGVGSRAEAVALAWSQVGRPGRGSRLA